MSALLDKLTSGEVFALAALALILAFLLVVNVVSDITKIWRTKPKPEPGPEPEEDTDEQAH